MITVQEMQRAEVFSSLLLTQTTRKVCSVGNVIWLPRKSPTTVHYFLLNVRTVPSITYTVHRNRI